MFSVCRRKWKKLSGAAIAALATTAILTAPGTVLPAAPALAEPGVTVHPGMEIRHSEVVDGVHLASRCTIGLTGAVGTARYAVTAGHCYRKGTITDKHGTPIGWFEFNRPDNGFDLGFGLIRLYEGVGVSASLGQFGLSSMDMKPKVGQEVCKLGSTTGWKCGAVSKVTDEWLFATKELGAEPGDSGAVVYRQTADGNAAFVGILVAYDHAQARNSVVEPAAYLFEQIDRYGPTRDDPFIWYRT